MATYNQLVQQAAKQLEEAKIPAHTASLYLLELSQLERTDLYLHYDEEVPTELEKMFLVGIERILKEEPMQYVLGFSWFYGYCFCVNQDVLIPRPETEELVSYILADLDEYFENETSISAADIGTGSGAIAISIAKEEPKIKMIATDISKEALCVAQKNANDLKTNVQFFEGDMLKPLIEKGIKVDLLVCNPPYIPQEELLEKSVKDYEPHVALFGGVDGLKFYRQVLECAHQVLNSKAILAFEIGYNQKETLLKEAEQYFPNANAEVIQDINEKDRMLFIRIQCESK